MVGVCVCLHVCMHVTMHLCMEASGRYEDVSLCYCNFSLLFLKQNLSLNLKPAISASLSGQWGPEIIRLCLPFIGVVTDTHSAWLLNACWRSEPRHFTLPTELFIQPILLFAITYLQEVKSSIKPIYCKGLNTEADVRFSLSSKLEICKN